MPSARRVWKIKLRHKIPNQAGNDATRAGLPYQACFKGASTTLRLTNQYINHGTLLNKNAPDFDQRHILKN